MNAWKKGILLLALFVAAGCVPTRAPQFVMVERGGDNDLTCENIAIEHKTNTEIAANKIAKNRSGDTWDIVIGFVVWPGLADFQNADGNEGNNLLDRNIRLREIAKAKGCKGMETWPPQPERY